MVSNEQRALVSPLARSVLIAVAILATQSLGQGSEKKFYADDPLLAEPAPRPVKSITTRHVNEAYDFLYNSLAVPRFRSGSAQGSPDRALDANTLGDVPDNAWYTKRHFFRRMSIEDLKRGPGNSTQPSPTGLWRVVSAKSDGVTPGFVIEDKQKNRYLLKLDSPEYPELSSATDMIGSKFFYALGYNTPENYIVRFHREKLEVSEGAFWRDPSGVKRPITERVLNELLKHQRTGPDGSYRALASRWIAGKLLGPFTYDGARADDPNDTIPHENRRVLRGLRVFGAWLNHQDTRSMNTMDTLVTEGGIPHVKHYLMDFGSILGSNATRPKDAWSGNQFVFEHKEALVQIATLGLYVPKWARAETPTIRGAGFFNAGGFDPISWKPTYPNLAFLRMDREDAFWAAKQVAAFSEAEIRAIVETGEYSDPRATEWMTQCLLGRAAKIVEAWLSHVSPLDKFAVVDGKLTFEDVRRGYSDGPLRQFTVRWASWDGDGRTEPLPNAAGPEVPDVRSSDGKYLAATVACAGIGACEKPVTVYLRRSETGHEEVVGIDR
ncbi:MAG: hypothetical protein H7Y20_14035 [Bryobacteraceae bacterium]|nr:hypothetical protein [Bryobacteraceae bacterium]